MKLQAEIGDKLAITLTVVRKVYPAQPAGYKQFEESMGDVDFPRVDTADDADRISNVVGLLNQYVNDELNVLADILKVQTWLSASGYSLGNVIIKNVSRLYFQNGERHG